VTAKDIAVVTGASGFVGSAVARALISEGFAVRAIVRKSSPRTNLHGLAAEIFEGDMRDAAAMRKAADGARYVFHVAADYRLWAPDPNEIMHANIEGTRAVMQAALAAKCERVVYTSSVATLKLHDDGHPSDETRPLGENEGIGVYKRSKVAAERLVEQMVANDGLPTVIVNPSTPIGPRDVRPTPTGRILVEAASGRMPAFVDTGLNIVHVDDVAAGMTLADMLGVIARLVGRKPPKVKLPRGLIFPLAYGAEAIARVTKREPFVTVDGLKMAKYRMFFSSEKAKRDLGYQSRPAEVAIRDALDWFRASGQIP
jgi:dihydroflavonol-4-reductase